MSFGIYKILICLTLCSAAVVYGSNREEIPIDTSAGLRLILDDVRGRIVIRTHEEPSVVAEMAIDTEQRGMKRDDSFGLRFAVAEGGVRIKGISSDSNRTYTIRIPKNVSILANLEENRDRIEIHDVNQAIEINVRDADIWLSDVAGPVVISTLRGDVAIEFAASVNEMPSSISTGVGAIHVRFPKQAARTVHVDCMEEELKSSIEFEKKFLTLGDYRRVKAVARLNGGGPSFYINTIRGEVTIDSE